MTASFDVDRQVASWLASERPNSPPAGLLEATLDQVASTPRRAGWQVLDRWTWRHSARIRTAARAAVLIAVLSMLVLLALWAVAQIGTRQPAPPYGLTTSGLIAFDTADGIVLSRQDGTDRRVVVAADGESISPTWSRDGLSLAYWHRPGSSGSWSLIVVDSGGKHPRVVAERVHLEDREQSIGQPSNIAWSPDSRQIAFAADAETGSSIFLASLGSDEPLRITDPGLQATDPAWRPDGSLIAFQSAATDTLHVVQPGGGGEHELASLAHTFLWPDWKPDGTAVATMAFVEDPDNPNEGQTEVFVVSVNGAITTNVSRDPADDFSPAWSPDGGRLAWDRIPADGSARAHVVVADVGGPNVIELRVDADLAQPVWAPDGSRIFSYVMGSDGKFHELIVIDPTGAVPIVRLPAEGNVGNSNWQRLP